MSTGHPTSAPVQRRTLLDRIEWLGNKLPDPVFLFIMLAAFVVVLSGIGAALGWSVQPLKPTPVMQDVGGGVLEPVRDAGTGRIRLDVVPVGEPIRVKSLLTSEGIYWALKNMIRNFINFPPLGVVLVGVLGVGVAEKVGFFGAFMKWMAALVPNRLLTPTIVFLGVMSSMASDAGYIVLPPLAAALYMAFGRSPVVGIAAAFAGVSGGFSANLLPSAGDALLAGFTTVGAQSVDPTYAVTPVANWWFIIASTLLVTLMGWFVTERIVEPRLRAKPFDQGGPAPTADARAIAGERLSPGESRGLLWSCVAFAGVVGVVLALTLVPGWPLHGRETLSPTASAPKWTQVVVPIIFFAFLLPGIVYGVLTGSIRSAGDVAGAFKHAMVTMAPIIVLAFFAAQFTEYLKYTNLDRMLAFVGGEALLASGLPPKVLLVALVLLAATINMFIGSMSAKWAILSPILVPMLMIVGISPELAQASYRVGDSVTNIITPLNSYVLIVLVVLQRYWKNAGLGTLIATMLPYSIVFTIGWTVLLVLWVLLGWNLGPDAGLWYPKQ